MGYEGLDFSDIEGISPSFAEGLYRRYKADPDSVDESWRGFFEGLEGTVNGPSWQRSNWPVAQSDELISGLDPTQMTIQGRSAPRQEAPSYSRPQITDDQIEKRSGQFAIRAMMLIRTYRVQRPSCRQSRSASACDQRELPADLTPAIPRLFGGRRSRYAGVSSAARWALKASTVRETRQTSCARITASTVGLEYMHINDLAERRFLQERMEGKESDDPVHARGQTRPSSTR